MTTTTTTPATEWTAALPTLEGLFTKNTTSLLRPFSLFGISLFRSQPSFPPSSLLQPLISLSQSSSDPVEKDSNNAHNPTLTPQSAIKALIGLQSFVTQLNEIGKTRKLVLSVESDNGNENEVVVSRVGDLLEGYVAGVGVAARVILDHDHEARAGIIKKRDEVDLREALKQCLVGMFAVRKLLADLHSASAPPSNNVISPLRQADNQLLGGILPPSETRYNVLSPLFSSPKKMLQNLLQPRAIHALLGAKHHANGTSANASAASPVRSPPEEDEVLFVLDILKSLEAGVEGIDSISVINSELAGTNGVNTRILGPYTIKGKTKASTKKQIKAMDEENKRRPLRIAMEAKVMRCDLALSMATRKMDDIKARAVARLGGTDAKDDGEDKDDDDNDEAQVDEGASGDEEDLKPKLEKDDDEEDSEDESASGRNSEASAPLGVKWENIAEEALVECLTAASQLLDEGRGEVLTSAIEVIDWVGEEGMPMPLRPDHAKSKSKSPSDDDDDDDKDEESDPETSESDFDPDASDSDTTDEMNPSHACPLRTIFRLHERFVEQRLGVWLGLPSSSRGKMGTFMRGEERKVGNAWDTMGLRLMLEYDSHTLLSFGLDADKLDKWLELAAAKNAKKIRRKGRKTI